MTDDNNKNSWEACAAAIADLHGAPLSNAQMAERMGAGFKHKTGMTPAGYHEWVITDGSPCDNLARQISGPTMTKEFNMTAPAPVAPESSPENNGPGPNKFKI